MNQAPAQLLDRASAAEYAGWFKSLADATRIQIVSLLARRGTEMNVGEIVASVDVGQSTVSAHLRVLAHVGFVLGDHRGPATYYRINDACVDSFPTAAEVVMSRPVAASSVPGAKGRAHRGAQVAAPTLRTRSTRDVVVDRYSSLARTAMAGEAIADDDPKVFAAGRFGA